MKDAYQSLSFFLEGPAEGGTASVLRYSSLVWELCSAMFSAPTSTGESRATSAFSPPNSSSPSKPSSHHNDAPKEEYHLETDFNKLHMPTFVALASLFFIGETTVAHPLDVIRTRTQIDRTVRIPSTEGRLIFPVNQIKFATCRSQSTFKQQRSFQYLRNMVANLGFRGTALALAEKPSHDLRSNLQVFILGSGQRRWDIYQETRHTWSLIVS